MSRSFLFSIGSGLNRFKAEAGLLAALALAVFCLCTGAAAEEAKPDAKPDLIDRARTLMAVRQYQEAAKVLEPYKGAYTDMAMYLRAYAIYKAGDTAGAEKVLLELEETFPNSRYIGKANMLRASMFLDKKAFTQAEELLRKYTELILSGDRKRAIADMYLKIAEAAIALPKVGDPAEKRPDYNKALRLFNYLVAMDLPDDMREHVLYRRTMVALAATRFGEVVTYGQEYMNEYDPFYKTEVKGELPGQGRKVEMGENAVRVRLAVIEASLQNSNALAKAEVYEDYGYPPQPWIVALLDNLLAHLRKGDMKDLANGEGLKQAMYSKPFAEGLKPSSERASEGDDFAIVRARRSVAAAKEFITAYPNDLRSLELMRQMPRTLLFAGLTDDAIAAFSALIAGDGLALQDAPADAEGLTPKERLLRYQAEAVYQSGLALFEMGKFGEAGTIWRKYLTAYPNGADWVAAQKGVYDAIKAVGAKALSEKRFEDCRTEWAKIVAERPVDPETPWLALAIAYTYVTEADKAIEDKKDKKDPAVLALYNKALDELSKVGQRYPELGHSYTPLYRAEIYRFHLDNLEAAVREYRLSETGEAQTALTELTAVQLSALTPKVFRNKESSFVTLKVRNVPKVSVRVYNITLADFFQKYHTTMDIRRLDLDLVSPDRTWEVPIPNYAQYKDISYDLPVEVDGPGAFAVTFEGEEYEATTLVIKSDIELITASSFDEAIVLVKDAVKEAPVEGAEVFFYAGDKKEHTLKLTTGKDGVGKGKFSEHPIGEPYMFASYKGNVAVTGAALSQTAATGLRPKGYIYTSRPVYLPGETVPVRGIIRGVKDGSYAVPEAGDYSVAIVSPDGKRIAEQNIQLGKFGSFNAEFKLPAECPLGRYTVSVSRKDESYTGVFQVEIVQPSKVFVEITPSVPAALAGDPVDMKVKAAYYTGLPLVNRAVYLSLPDGRTVTLTTNDKGEAVYALDTTPFYMSGQVSVSAQVPGEDAYGSATVPLLPAALRLAITLPDEKYLVNQRIDVPVKLTTPDDKPLAGKKIAVEVYRKGMPFIMPLPMAVMENSGIRTEEVPQATRDERIFQTELTTADDGAATFSYVFKEACRASFVFTAVDDKNRILTNTRLLTVEAPPTPQLSFETAQATAKVGDEIKVTVHNDDLPGLGLLVYTGDSILSYATYRFEKGAGTVAFRVGNEYFPNFKLIGLATGDHRLNRAEQAFDVQRKLTVTIKLPEGPLVPGSEVEAVVEARDHTGKPVEAEISLSLVDKGLLARYADPTTNIVKFFEQGLRRTVEFLSFSSITFERLGEQRHIATEVLEEQRRLVEKGKADAFKDGFGKREAAGAQNAMPAAPAAAAKPMATRGVALAEAAEGAPAEDEMLAMDKSADALGAGSGGAMRAEKKAMGRKAGADRERLKAQEAQAAPSRREMPIGAFWIGNVTTGRDGKAKVKITVPERTSQYRVQLRGVTTDTLLAELETEATVRRDLFVDLKLPGYLFEGDKVRPVITVHNAGDFKGKVDLKLDIVSGETKRNYPMTVDVSGKGVFEQVADAYDVPAGEKLQATLIAESGGNVLDKIEKESNIRLWGVEERAGRVASTAQDTVFTLTLPSSVRKETLSLDLDLFPGVEGALLDMVLNPSGDVPDIGLKPMASRIVALLAIANLMGQGKVAGEQVERLKQAAQSAVSALVSSQQNDGSWPWIYVSNRGTGTDASTSAWAVLALDMALKAGVVTDPSARDRGVNYLKAFVSRGGDTTAHLEAMYVLAVAGQADFSQVNRLYRSVNGLTTERKALLGLAFLAMGKNDYATNIATMVAGELPGTIEKKMPLAADSADPVYARAVGLMLLARVGGMENDVRKVADVLRGDVNGTGVSGAARWLGLAALAEGSGPVNTERPAFTVNITVNGKVAGAYKGSRDVAAGHISLKAAELGGLPVKVEIQYKGRGEMAYRAVLKGFSPVIQSSSVFSFGLTGESFFHSPMLYKGRRLAESTMFVALSAYDDYVEDGLKFTSRDRGISPGEYTVVTRWIPAGMTLDKTSLPGSAVFSREAGGRLTIVFRGNPSDFRLRLLPYCPGDYRALPAEYASAVHPGDYERLGNERKLAVLVPGAKDDAPYQWSLPEHIAFGQAYFNDDDYVNALPHLSAVPKKERLYYRDVVKDLLWIYCAPEQYKPAEVIDLFEVLSQRYPDVNIPYEKLLVIGNAYHDSGEDEAACYLWKATLSSSFRDDMPVAAELESAGEYLRGVEYLRRLFWEYPDLPIVTQSLYGLSQDIYAHKDQARNLVPIGGEKGSLLPENVVAQALDVLKEFLAMFGDLPYSDEATFSLLNAYLDLSAYDACLNRAQGAVDLYPESKYRDRYRYISALAAFHLGRYDQAIQAALAVGEGAGPDSRFATYILGQMYQALGRYADALLSYRKVKNDFADAALSIEYIERSTLSLPEVVTGDVGTPIEAEVSYCNISTVSIMAYRVDLMRLFLKEKNLDRIAGVNLAGITPTFTFERELPKVTTGTTGKTRISLPIKEMGAYLVLARSGEVFASGLVLITPLKMEVQEYQGAVRVTVLESATAKPAEKVHIKASTGYGFTSAETDLRGSATINVSGGSVTVVARRGKDEYVFFRSKAMAVPQKQRQAVSPQQIEYNQSILYDNQMLQQQGSSQLRGNFNRRAKDEQGVRAAEAAQQAK
jgi:hypothetical protein